MNSGAARFSARIACFASEAMDPMVETLTINRLAVTRNAAIRPSLSENVRQFYPLS